MSLLSTPFVGTTADTVLHVVASTVMVGFIVAIAWGFWRFHELPVHKAKMKQHQQISLITALTWIGFLWHWVWVLAVIIAFVDFEAAIRKFHRIWQHEKQETAEVLALNKVQDNA